MAVFLITMRGIKETQEWVKHASEQMKENLKEVIRETAQEIETRSKPAAPSNTGALSRSIGTLYFWEDARYPDWLLARVRATKRYGACQEFGTGPLGAASNTSTLPVWYQHGMSIKAPYVWKTKKGVAKGKIVPWAKAHGIDPWVLARSIKRKGGIPAKPFMGPAAEDVSGDFYAKAEIALLVGE
jgi:hypothetical protein